LHGKRTVAALAEHLSGVLATNLNRGGEAAGNVTSAPNVAAPTGADIRLRYLAPQRLIDEGVHFEAAALTYIPERFAEKGGLGPAELQAALGADPFLSSIVDSSIGTVGTFMLPLRASELFADPQQTRRLIGQAMALASERGSQIMTLTGLLPAATDYGAALTAHNGHHSLQSVTTGHALTTATIVANLADLLRRCGRRLEDERIAIVGLGSVGRSVLELMFRALPPPHGLVLCDLYVNSSDLAAIERRIREQFAYRRDIEIVTGDAGLPQAVRDAKLIVCAVDRVGVIDPRALLPGTILLDDSYPPAFDPAIAWRRMTEQKDVVIATGGFARLPSPVRETFYVPHSARPFLAAYGEDNFIREFQREAQDYTACVFAGPLSLRDPTLEAQVGIPTPAALEAFYRAFERHNLASATPQCDGRVLPAELFARLKAGLPDIRTLDTTISSVSHSA
jgi:predicted amino acid dehydrogenase